MYVSIIFLFLLKVSAIYVDPINLICSENRYISWTSINYKGATIRQFNLPPFSQSFIKIDLRHLSLQLNSSGINYLIRMTRDKWQKVLQIEDLINSNNLYNVEVTKNIQLSIFCNISDDKSEYKYLIMQSTCITIQLQNTRIPQTTSTFLFVVYNRDNINLPINKPSFNNQGYFLSKIKSNNVVYPSWNVAQTTTSNAYWNVQNSFATPYIPYISNCDNQGQNIYFSSIIQDPQCQLVGIDNTIPISQLKFGSFPVADKCSIKRTCYYDKINSLTKNQLPYWQSLPSSLTIFSITEDKIPYEQYQINQQFPVTSLVKCKIVNSKGSNSTENLPLKVKMNIGYYQINKERKKMISCNIEYSLYVGYRDNFKYQFQLEFIPMNHTNIMLAFGFNWYVYLLIFIIFGVISNFQNFVLWLYHFLVSSHRSFHIKIYIQVMKELIKGTLTGLLILVVTVIAIAIIMNGKIFNYKIYSDSLPSSVPRVFWDSLASTSSFYNNAQTQNLRSGRMGLSFIIVGALFIFNYSIYFIGKQKKRQYYKQYEMLGRKFKPYDWIRGKFVLGTFFYIFLMLAFIYFAYSTLYSTQIWLFFFIIKILQIFMEQINRNIFEDLLPCLPFKIIIDITAYMNTLSANNLYDFLFSFLIDVGMNMAQKAYIFQILNIAVDKIKQKGEMVINFYEKIINDTQQEVNDNSTKEEKVEEDQDHYIILNMQPDQVHFFENDEEEQHSDDNNFIYETHKKSLVTSRLYKTQNNQSIFFDKQSDIQSIKDFEKPDEQEVFLKQRLQKYMDDQNHDLMKKFDDQPVQNQQNDKEKQLTMLFQLIVQSFSVLFTFFLQPYVVIIMWMTYDQSSVLNNYGIQTNTVILYVLSAIIIGLFTSINIILIFLILESYFNFNFEKVISQLLYRYDNRKVFWKANDDDINSKLQLGVRGAQHYCLSSQFFFLLTIYVTAMIFVILGICTMINVTYNPFQDLGSLIIILFWVVAFIIFQWILEKIAQITNLWGYRDFLNIEKIKSSKKVGQKQFEQIQVQNNGLEQQNTHTNNLQESQVQSFIEDSKQFHQYTQKKLSVQEKPFRKQRIRNFQEQQEIKTHKIKLQTICKKLQSTFVSQKFKLEYCLKNKNFIKRNIQKILPLVKNLPQLTEYKLPSNQNRHQNGKNSKNQTKNMEPFVTQIMVKWLKAAEKNRQNRQSVGMQLEKQLKRCSFCYKNWSVYHGYGGICFDCSKKIEILEQQKDYYDEKSKKRQNKKNI